MQFSDMKARVSARLNEGASGPVYYPDSELGAALNEAQRLFCLLTLGLEITSPFAVPAAVPLLHMLPIFPDWIVPLRFSALAGAKVRPARLEDLGALDGNWLNSPVAGTPSRYAFTGGDLIAFYGQSTAQVTLNCTYARAPVPLTIPTQVQEIPEEYAGPALVNYGIYRCRQGESGQELEKSMKYLGGFLDAATHYAAYVRARNAGSRYDNVPFELESFDRSKLLRLRVDLAPNRRITPVD
jgi:hypothetical protein